MTEVQKGLEDLNEEIIQGYARSTILQRYHLTNHAN